MIKFTCWFVDDEPEDGEQVSARFGYEAAERFVEKRERRDAEYDCASGARSMTVLVRSPLGKVETYEVTGEMMPHYKARALPGDGGAS